MKLIQTENTKVITKELRQLVTSEGRDSKTLKIRWMQLKQMGYRVHYIKGGKHENVTVFEVE